MPISDLDPGVTSTPQWRGLREALRGPGHTLERLLGGLSQKLAGPGFDRSWPGFVRPGPGSMRPGPGPGPWPGSRLG